MCAARLKALHRQISTGGSVGVSVRSDTSSYGEQVKGEEPGTAYRPSKSAKNDEAGPKILFDLCCRTSWKW